MGSVQEPDQALKKVLKDCVIRHFEIIYAEEGINEKELKANLMQFRRAIRDAGYNEIELDQYFTLFNQGAQNIIQTIRNAIRGLPADTPFDKAIAKPIKRS